jgi:hypothetical protein
MKFRHNCAAENRVGSGVSAGSSLHRKVLAMGTAVLLALSSVAPAWAVPAGSTASTAAGAATRLAAAWHQHPSLLPQAASSTRRAGRSAM